VSWKRIAHGRTKTKNPTSRKFPFKEVKEDEKVNLLNLRALCK